MTTNNTNNYSTPTTVERKGTGIGTKVKGAAEFIHGAGDNLRGALLGSVDTMTNSQSAKNDELATRGRLEMQKGTAHMKGLPTPPLDPPGASSKDHIWSSSEQGKAQTQTQGLATDSTFHHGQGSFAQNPITQTQVPARSTVGPSQAVGPTEPVPLHASHHREDAIAGVPQAQLNEVQATAAAGSHPEQTHVEKNAGVPPQPAVPQAQGTTDAVGGSVPNADMYTSHSNTMNAQPAFPPGRTVN